MGQALLKPGIDPESRLWLTRLRSPGPERERALAALRELLLRAARFEVQRRAASYPGSHELEDLAQQAADDALLAITRKLEDFRGDSRFTTWAYKFALLEAGVRMRRRAWHGREVPLEQEGWSVIPAPGPTPASEVQTRELLAVIGEAIDRELSSHQRDVLVALALNEVPIDVLAERLQTTRGALYKTLHDARRKLRAVVAAQGLDIRPGAEEESR